ncbi:hypothetical protein HMPREF9952_0509 [Haemophilus pittmaniae HK 85]|uniref:Uncharacterized protein n=1 Tax=Haemophilus pittmaniae HK 85 TaxID=1035188 RepID=F9QAK8_9PAST|nr:hypothetical protein HMPREF9952_0509 [Haemophilus pittmaniae HK 85]
MSLFNSSSKWRSLWAVAGLALCIGLPVNADTAANTLPTEKALKSDLTNAQKLPDGDDKNTLISTIQGSLDLLKQIQTQQKANDDLQNTIAAADAEIQKIIMTRKPLRNNWEQRKAAITTMFPWMTYKSYWKNSLLNNSRHKRI